MGVLYRNFYYIKIQFTLLDSYFYFIQSFKRLFLNKKQPSFKEPQPYHNLIYVIPTVKLSIGIFKALLCLLRCQGTWTDTVNCCINKLTKILVNFGEWKICVLGAYKILLYFNILPINTSHRFSLNPRTHEKFQNDALPRMYCVGF